MKPRTALALLAAGLVAGVALSVSLAWSPPLSAQSVEEQNKLRAELRALEQAYRPFTDALNKVAELVKPSVVRIVVESKDEPKLSARRRRPLDADELWRFFQENPRDFLKRFGDRVPEPKRFGVGSGIIIDPSGHILTNEHVIAGSDEGEVRVTLFGEKDSVRAKVTGRDPKSDLAVIQIDVGRRLPALRFADPDKVKVGDVVVAVGHPLGYSHTVSQGIVSHKGRTNALRGLRRSLFAVEDFIQTDAAINPGNSGGPLVNLRGEVVGINSFIASRSGGSIGLGFAVSSRIAEKVAKALIKDGRVVRGYLGVVISDINDGAAQELGLSGAAEIVTKLKLKSADGALVLRVEPDTPAAKAGLEAQDVIVEYGGEPIRGASDVTQLVRNTDVGSRAEIKVVRDGTPKVLSATIMEQPDDVKVAGRTGDAKAHRVKSLGMRVQTLTPELAKRLGIPDTRGVLVTDVDPGKPAAQAGIEANDVIRSVGLDKVTDAEEFLTRVKAAEEQQRGIVVNIKGKGMVILK